MEVGLVQKIDIDSEMQQAYLDYAMSVIVARALPDARDGLKPVHRRILYAMYDMGLRPDSPHKKSARIVGEVLGKYHPHSDMAVYDALARMAQDFSMRALLVDGQGNFGSVDGDSPAAMRYTEARPAPLAAYLLADIQKNTVDFSDNFDGTLQEPLVLPAALPNLLVNGATGIAVGMATSIPPHNLGEVVDALVYLLGKWEKVEDITIEDLMGFVKGPDFPTGGIIIQDPSGDGLPSAYATGRGRITVQARAHLEEMSRGRNRIIVTELPYMTNKAALIERIAELVREEKLEGVADLRDESDRQGMRIVIELTKTADPETVLRELYRITPMRTTFSLIMLALVDGEPRLLSLKQALRVYLEHRLVIVRRRSQYDLDKARQRSHILEGLRIALQNLDAVIDLIRRSRTADSAKRGLIKRFKLSEVQAQAILDMPLRRLAALERRKIEDEYKEVQVQIKDLEALLRSPRKMRQVIITELKNLKEAFGDPRRTHIVQMGSATHPASLLTTDDFVAEQDVWVMISPEGAVTRTAGDQLPSLEVSGPANLLVLANTRDTLYLVAETGEAAAIPMHVLPTSDRLSDGTPFHKLSPLAADQKLVAAFASSSTTAREAAGGRDTESARGFVMTITRQGLVKKTTLDELPGPTAQTFVLTRVNPGDSLGWLHLTDGEAEVLLSTAHGMAIRFSETEVRPMGLVAAGVLGIKLQSGDEVSGAVLAPAKGEIFMLASDGTAKRVSSAQFPRQGRYGQGVLTWKLPRGVQLVGLAVGGTETQAILHLSKGAPRVIRMAQAVHQGRASRGKAVVDLRDGSRVVRLTIAWQPLGRSTKIPAKAKKPATRPRRPKATGVDGKSQVKQASKPRKPKGK
jgi:DNA gyrase subunit A